MRSDRYQTQEDADDDPVRWAFFTGVRLLEAGRASLLVRNDHAPVLTVAASVGIDREVVPSIRVSVGEGIAGMVAHRGMVLFGSRAGTTFICAPLVTGRGVEGVLSLTDRLGGAQYGEEHIDKATLLAAHLAYLLEFSRRRSASPDTTSLNNVMFEELLERELARSKRIGSPFAVAVLALSNLGEVKERLGAVGVTEVVRLVGEALDRSLRRYDFVRRYGDGRFAVLLAGPIDAESDVGTRIMDAVAAAARQMDIDLEARLGFAYCPMDGISASVLVGRADARLQASKQEKMVVR